MPDLIRVSERAARMAQAYRSGSTLAEVGREFGITKQRASQILKAIPGIRLRPRGPSKTRCPAIYMRGVQRP